MPAIATASHTTRELSSYGDVLAQQWDVVAARRRACQFVRVAQQEIDAVGVKPQPFPVRDLVSTVGIDRRFADVRDLHAQPAVLVDGAHAGAVERQAVRVVLVHSSNPGITLCATQRQLISSPGLIQAPSMYMPLSTS
ncbi:hypothetical protein G6F40_014822 [Rhizopus arrhizus]|nr:hypothetical protein G6F40_014822 [Rhizopus arrhizus]